MKPEIIHLSSLSLVGLSYFGDPFETSDPWSESNQIGRLWARFSSFLDQQSERIGNRLAPDTAYEVHIYQQETLTHGYFEVFVGVQVSQLDQVPVELLVKLLPASDYAVFTLEGPEIISDWVNHIDVWLAEAGYSRSQPYSIQVYDQRFRGMDQIADSILDVYMPVMKISDPER